MSILSCVNQIIELLQIIICTNYLCRPRYSLKINDYIFLVAEVVFIELANWYQLSDAVFSIIVYSGIYVYVYTKFKESFRRTVVYEVLYFMINSFMQLICSGIIFLISMFIPVENGTVWILIINVFVLIMLLWLKKHFYRLSKYVLNSNYLTYIAIGGALFVIAYLVVVYKIGNYFRETDYLVFGVVTVLICVLALSWQKEKYEKISKEKEIALREQYDEIFHDLVMSVRRKQHDIDDHINVIYCQHKMAQSLEDLISTQEEYCKWIKEDTAISCLLRMDNPILGGFLYSKLCQAKDKGCSVDYDIKIKGFHCEIPIYKMVEILTVLLNNAMEALENRGMKNLRIKVLESETEIMIVVQNSFDQISRKEMINFIKPGYSTKGNNRGQGLAKVMDILHSYGGDLKIESVEDEIDLWISFEVYIKKEGD